MNKKLILAVGTTFGRWKVNSEKTIRVNNLTNWECECECGTIQHVPLNNLMNGSSSQCKGCATKKSGKKRRSGVGLISGDYWSQIKAQVLRKKIPFEIRIEEAWDLFNDQEGRCAITGRKLVLSGYPYNKKETTAILSEINLNQGFVKGNVLWLHKDVSYVRRDLSLKQLYLLAEEIVNG